MALAHKFTWGEFLKKNPEFKKKGTKRTAPEADKAFKAAFKDFAKGYLKNRQDDIKKEKDRVAKTKKELVTKLKAVDGKKWQLKAKKLNQEIGRFDSYLARLEQEQKRATALTKNI